MSFEDLGCLAKAVGRSRTPAHWNGASVSLPCSRLEEEVVYQVVSGRKKRVTDRDVLARTAQIWKLDLAGTVLTGLEIGKRMQIRHELVHLKLGYAGLDADAVRDVVQGIPKALLTLDIGGNKIGDEMMQRICAFHPKQLQQLQQLTLSDVDIGDESILPLCNVLRESGQLFALHLARNRITRRGMETLSNELLRIDYYRFKFEDLLVLLEEQDEEALGPPLEKLDLSWNRLCDDDLDVLHDVADACLHRIRFRELIFHGNGDLYEVAHTDKKFLSQKRRLELNDLSLRREIRFAMIQREKPLVCPFTCGLKHIREWEEEIHFNACVKSPFQCTHCSDWIITEQQKEHEKQECSCFPFSCMYDCGTIFTRGEDPDFEEKRKVHERNECPQRPVFCELGCEITTMLAKERARHYETECPERIIPCEYIVTCEAEVKAKEMNAHIKQHRDDHARKLIEKQARERDEAGAENQFARKCMGKLEALCAEMSLSLEERTRRRQERELAIKQEAKDLFEAARRVGAAKRKQAFLAAKESFGVWTEFVPRQCSNMGCQEKILDRYMANHNDVCEFALVRCELGCEDKNVRRKDLEDHLENTCVERILTCNRGNCLNHQFPAKEKDKHDRDFHTKIQ